MIRNKSLFSGGQPSFQPPQSQDQFVASQAARQQQLQAALLFAGGFPQQNQPLPNSDSFAVKSPAISPFAQTAPQLRFGTTTASGPPRTENFQALQPPQGGDSLTLFRQQLQSGQIQFGAGLPHTATQAWSA
jgi:hypothetical protein